MILRFVLLFILGFSLLTSCKQKNEGTKKGTIVEQKVDVYTEIAQKTTKTNWLQPPFKHWAIKNVDKLFDVGIIAKGNTPFALKENPIDFSGLMIEQFDGKVYGFEEHLDSNRTDGFLILHKGEIAYEKYFGNMKKSSSHNWFSVSKSLTGLTLAVLAAEGKIDLEMPTLAYLPDLKGSAWDGTTVQMVMDMLVGIEYSEKYYDPNSDAYKFAKISNFVAVPGPASKFKNIPEYMTSVKKGIDHNQLFHYVSLNTEILGMLITKVTGKQPSEVMSEKIWSKIGTEYDGYIAQDPNGQELVSAAINSTVRDAGRLGQLMLENGQYNGEQIIPKNVTTVIKAGGSPEKFADSKRGKMFKNFSYKNQWWHTDDNAFFAKGLFGQWIYVDPDTESVIVKFTTADVPTSTEYDWINNMNMMRGIVRKLKDY